MNNLLSFLFWTGFIAFFNDITNFLMCTDRMLYHWHMPNISQIIFYSNNYTGSIFQLKPFNKTNRHLCSFKTLTFSLHIHDQTYMLLEWYYIVIYFIIYMINYYRIFFKLLDDIVNENYLIFQREIDVII